MAALGEGWTFMTVPERARVTQALMKLCEALGNPALIAEYPESLESMLIALAREKLSTPSATAGIVQVLPLAPQPPTATTATEPTSEPIAYSQKPQDRTVRYSPSADKQRGETPRTDAEAAWQHKFNGVIPHLVSADFARQLERELVAMTADRDMWFKDDVKQNNAVGRLLAQSATGTTGPKLTHFYCEDCDEFMRPDEPCFLKEDCAHKGGAASTRGENG